MSGRPCLLAERDGPTRAGLRLALATPASRSSRRRQDARRRDRGRARASTRCRAREHGPAGRRHRRGRGDRGMASGHEGHRAERRPDGQELLAAVLAGATRLSLEGDQPRAPPSGAGGVSSRARWRCRAAIPSTCSTRCGVARSSATLVAAHANAALTDREWEILRLLGEDASTVQMAQRLEISRGDGAPARLGRCSEARGDGPRRRGRGDSVVQPTERAMGRAADCAAHARRGIVTIVCRHRRSLRCASTACAHGRRALGRRRALLGDMEDAARRGIRRGAREGSRSRPSRASGWSALVESVDQPEAAIEMQDARAREAHGSTPRSPCSASAAARHARAISRICAAARRSG